MIPSRRVGLRYHRSQLRRWPLMRFWENTGPTQSFFSTPSLLTTFARHVKPDRFLPPFRQWYRRCNETEDLTAEGLFSRGRETRKESGQMILGCARGDEKMRRLRVLLMLCSALVFASTVRAQGTAGTNNAELNGDYAFTFNGFSGSSGGPSRVFDAVGRFTADGAGNLTNGKLDTNGIGPGTTQVAQTFTGTYAIGADHRGVMNIQGGAKFAFAMMANGNAQFIEFDASGGNGRIGSGTIEKADTTAYDSAKITGDYAFGVVGQDHLNHRAAMAGRFTSDGTGSLTNAAGDVNAYGALSPMSFTTASYTVSDTATGRGTLNLSFTFGGGSASLNFVFYITKAGKLFVMERDTVTTSSPLLNGIVLRQQSPAGGFSNASLNGRMVIYLTGLSPCGSATATVPKAVA